VDKACSSQPGRTGPSGSNPGQATRVGISRRLDVPHAPSLFKMTESKADVDSHGPHPGRMDPSIHPLRTGHRGRRPAGDGSRIHPVPTNRAPTARETVRLPFADAGDTARGLERARRSRHRWMLKSPPRRVAAGSNALPSSDISTAVSGLAPRGIDPRPVFLCGPLRMTRGGFPPQSRPHHPSTSHGVALMHPP